MKRYLNFVLARQPRIYKLILKLKGNQNLEKDIFLTVVRDGDVVFDIGANRGYYTILFSHLVGSRGKVHAFEPVPPTFKILSETVLREKKFNNIELNNLAVGDTNEEITMHMPGNDDGQASMVTHNAGSWKKIENITSYNCNEIKLDDYATSRSIQSLEFIKCDVEGAELLVLRGATKLIADHLPIVYLEVFSNWTKSFGYTPSNIVEFLMALGYSKFYLVEDKSIQVLIEPIRQLKEEKLSSSANILCTVPRIHSFRTDNLMVADGR